MRIKICLPLILLLSLNCTKSFGKGCDYITITFGSMTPIVFSQSQMGSQTYVFNIDSAYDFNAPISDTLRIYEDGWSFCGWYINTTYVTDTGYTFISLITYEFNSLIVHLNITRNSNITSLQNPSLMQMVFLSTVSSEGILRINPPGVILKDLTLFDSAGRIILTSNKVHTELDVARFSPGFYFYALTDEKLNSFRGKFFKD